MSLDDQLKVIATEEIVPLPEPRNYWNTSGANKEFFPTEPRPDSIPTLSKQGRVIQEPSDEWWINSKKHHYCFWTLVRDNSQPDGTMEPLLQSEMSQLFGCSSTKTHFMVREAMERLTASGNLEILKNLLELTADEPSDEVIPYAELPQFEEVEEEEEAE